MPSVPFERLRRRAARAAIIAALLAAVAVAAFLPFAGTYLVTEDPVQPSDVMFVLAGARAERWMESWDLFREGAAPRIVLSPGRLESGEERLRELGIRYPGEADLARDALVQLGVPADAITILPASVDNTAQESAVLHAIALRSGWRRIIVITSRYHTRRTRFAFTRQFGGSGIDILVRGSRYDGAVPSRWWRRRGDARFVAFELQKLVAYRLGLGE